MWGLIISKWCISIYTHFIRTRFTNLLSLGRVYPVDEFCLHKIGKFLINIPLLGSQFHRAQDAIVEHSLFLWWAWSPPVCCREPPGSLWPLLISAWSLYLAFESATLLGNTLMACFQERTLGDYGSHILFSWTGENLAPVLLHSNILDCGPRAWHH